MPSSACAALRWATALTPRSGLATPSSSSALPPSRPCKNPGRSSSGGRHQLHGSVFPLVSLAPAGAPAAPGSAPDSLLSRLLKSPGRLPSGVFCDLAGCCGALAFTSFCTVASCRLLHSQDRHTKTLRSPGCGRKKIISFVARAGFAGRQAGKTAAVPVHLCSVNPHVTISSMFAQL